MVLCFAAPVYAHPVYAFDPQNDAAAPQQPGDASAPSSVPIGQQSGDQWSTDEARRAYRAGYDAGLQAAPGSAAPIPVAPSSAPAMASDMGTHSSAERFGYDDGLAEGRADRDRGHPFKPTDGSMYKSGDHGWTADFGDKGHYRQLYRQSYAEGYQNGYGAATPR